MSSFFGKLSGESETRIASIARNLEAVLNAKRGHAAAVEVFGLGSYDAYFASGPLVEALIAEMLEVIRACEPRLLDPAIVLIGRDRLLWVRFKLTGRVGETPRSFTILFHSIFRNVSVHVEG